MEYFLVVIKQTFICGGEKWRQSKQSLVHVVALTVFHEDFPGAIYENKQIKKKHDPVPDKRQEGDTTGSPWLKWTDHYTQELWWLS